MVSLDATSYIVIIVVPSVVGVVVVGTAVVVVVMVCGCRRAGARSRPAGVVGKGPAGVGGKGPEKAGMHLVKSRHLKRDIGRCFDARKDSTQDARSQVQLWLTKNSLELAAPQSTASVTYSSLPALHVPLGHVVDDDAGSTVSHEVLNSACYQQRVADTWYRQNDRLSGMSSSEDGHTPNYSQWDSLTIPAVV